MSTGEFQPGTPFSDAPAAPGDFFVDELECMACGAPAMEAPDLMAHRPSNNSCFFVRQPSNDAETVQAARAVWASCCGAVQYRGHNRKIIKLIEAASVAWQPFDAKPDNDRPILTKPDVSFFSRLFRRSK